MPFNFGAFAGGLAKGLNEGEKLRQAREESKLKTKMLDAQARHLDFQNQQLQNTIESARQAHEIQQATADAFRSSITEGQPAQPGFENEAAQMSQAPTRATIGPKAMSSNEIALEGLLRQGKATSGAFSGGTRSQSLAFATPQEALAFKNSPEYKQLYPFGARLNQTSRGLAFEGINPQNAAANAFHSELAQSGDRAKATKAYNEVLYGAGASNAAGKVAGEAAQFLGEPIAPMQPNERPFPPASQVQSAPSIPGPVTPSIRDMSVGDLLHAGQPAPATPGETSAQRAARRKGEIKNETKPVEPSTAKELGGLETLLNKTVGDIKANYDNGAYLGPIKGDESAYSFRRRFGTTIGQPVTDREAVFRSALSDASDQLLRARSGAQINEQEFKRLKDMLPKATDEPQVFQANLKRFEGQVQATMTSRKKFGTMTRGELGQGSGTGRLVPRAPGQ